MENRVPLPTDNIYKFYSLFGLLLAVFSIGSIIFVNNATNDFVFEIAVEYETLKADPALTLPQEARFQVLDRKLEIARNDRWLFLFSLGVVLLLGVLMMWYGFKKWHTEVQPLQDEITRLSIKKLKQEVGEAENA